MAEQENDPAGYVTGTEPNSDAEPHELSRVPVQASGSDYTMDSPIQRRSDADPVIGDIESALEANGFPTDRVDGKGLKVNLRSRGMFEFNSNRLSESAIDSLTRLVAVLEKQEGMSIHVVGHTDTRGASPVQSAALGAQGEGGCGLPGQVGPAGAYHQIGGTWRPRYQV